LSGADGEGGDFLLDVPLIHQGPNCGCGLASIAMALNAAGIITRLEDLERHPLILPEMLRHWGIGPGRLGRLALACGAQVTIVDPAKKDVGDTFLRKGGRWIAREPQKADLERCLTGGRPAVACIPDKRDAFEGARGGSHWVVVVGMESGEFVIRDPAPWRKAVRCTPGYWEDWACSLIIVEGPGTAPVLSE